MLSRKQFPLALSFAITINKLQGQLFEAVGVDLRSPVFSHSQFYVAALRVTLQAGLCILLSPDINHTSNIVYPEILQGLA
jgi:ATP-dependent exoDNAse (exonuclease V) alpha subunit